MTKLKINFCNKDALHPMPNGTKTLLRKSALTVLETEEIEGFFEINISLVNPTEIKTLNGNWRSIDKVTDVLSFPAADNRDWEQNPETGAFFLGDVIICSEKAISQAEEYRHSLQRELSFLTVHSVLHLLGYDHVDDKKREKEMQKREKEVMEIMKPELNK